LSLWVCGEWCTACGRVRRATWNLVSFVPSSSFSVFLALAVRALCSSSCRYPSLLPRCFACRTPPAAALLSRAGSSVPPCLLPPPFLRVGPVPRAAAPLSPYISCLFCARLAAHSRPCPYTALSIDGLRGADLTERPRAPCDALVGAQLRAAWT
jgi:hypothetical protein